MDTLITTIITLWGLIGIIAFGAGYALYKYIIHGKEKTPADIQPHQQTIINTEPTEKIKNIESILTHIDDNMLAIKESRDSIEEFHLYFKDEIKRIDEKIDKLKYIVLDEIEKRLAKKIEDHNRFMFDQVKTGPKLHNIMEKYLPYINTDHMFLGSFHNGKSSIAGIPYCKYDIVAEQFSPESITLELDTEFASMYKDVDIIRHNKLPLAALQSGIVYFKINPDKTSELSKIDDIIYRRMLGRDIKQFACAIIHQYTDDANINGKPIGFVGCIKYNYEEMDLKELQKCANELEAIYNGKN